MHHKQSKKVSLNIPSSFWPSPLKNSQLTPTEQKIYFRLSIEFQIILDESTSYQMGAYKWNLILEQRLQKHGLTTDEWERISDLGDNDNNIQDQLAELIEKMESQLP